MEQIILKVAVQTAIDQVLERLRATLIDMAEQMESGELPKWTGPQALRMVADTIAEERRRREAAGIGEK